MAVQAEVGLQIALHTVVRGDVRATQMDRLLYSTDASSYRLMPTCVVCPVDADDVASAVTVVNHYRASVVPRGGGTSLSGQTVGEGVVVDLSRHMNDLIELNTDKKWAWVQAGIPLANLNRLLAPHGLKVGPDPASAVAATIGGMTGNNSTGSHSVIYGMMADHVKAVDVVLSNGEQVRFEPKTPEQVAVI
ncbi:MAG: FAD-binding oxidoreductase, partial [Chloroflexota bacterium]